MGSPSWMGLKKTGHGPQCQGLLDEEVLGHRLALMISEVFSKLVHSVRLERSLYIWTVPSLLHISLGWNCKLFQGNNLAQPAQMLNQTPFLLVVLTE